MYIMNKPNCLDGFVLGLERWIHEENHEVLNWPFQSFEVETKDLRNQVDDYVDAIISLESGNYSECASHSIPLYPDYLAIKSILDQCKSWCWVLQFKIRNRKQLNSIYWMWPVNDALTWFIDQYLKHTLWDDCKFLSKYYKWASYLAKSRPAFERTFKFETGHYSSNWRQIVFDIAVSYTDLNWFDWNNFDVNVLLRLYHRSDVNTKLFPRLEAKKSDDPIWSQIKTYEDVPRWYTLILESLDKALWLLPLTGNENQELWKIRDINWNVHRVFSIKAIWNNKYVRILSRELFRLIRKGSFKDYFDKNDKNQSYIFWLIEDFYFIINTLRIIPRIQNVDAFEMLITESNRENMQKVLWNKLRDYWDWQKILGIPAFIYEISERKQWWTLIHWDVCDMAYIWYLRLVEFMYSKFSQWQTSLSCYDIWASVFDNRIPAFMRKFANAVDRDGLNVLNTWALIGIQGDEFYLFSPSSHWISSEQNLLENLKKSLADVNVGETKRNQIRCRLVTTKIEPQQRSLVMMHQVVKALNWVRELPELEKSIHEELNRINFALQRLKRKLWKNNLLVMRLRCLLLIFKWFNIKLENWWVNVVLMNNSKFRWFISAAIESNTWNRVIWDVLWYSFMGKDQKIDENRVNLLFSYLLSWNVSQNFDDLLKHLRAVMQDLPELIDK